MNKPPAPAFNWFLFFLSLGIGLWWGYDLGPCLIAAAMMQPIMDVIRRIPQITREEWEKSKQ